MMQGLKVSKVLASQALRPLAIWLSWRPGEVWREETRPHFVWPAVWLHVVSERRPTAKSNGPLFEYGFISSFFSGCLIRVMTDME